ncbi:Transducin family protein / WD-40 repeat family protein isoform 2 [Hibiscus syriacus]|uniref:Transducin family protein / WD-40 repeat family protein isoform 2 n=1 Tax=Hibiscus syriacus TaxID=106335 RepID=A0A6A3BM60_HIBSY|nr:Transducin family protein / WD-40 repeat family protein isoform 2 [Hibiscus syriacus]
MRDYSVRAEDLNAPSGSSSRRTGNVFQLLARREVSPRTKRSSRKLWVEGSKSRPDSFGPQCQATRDARSDLLSWVEAESLRHFSAKYCPLLPPPRSTIAAAFSPDGKTLASTHGDHTVKIIDCQTGNCLKVLSGHRRTPWVVRFHPLYPEILASGSLDHEVRLWNANTADCIGTRDFYRPIASIAFHAQGEVLAVASGHKERRDIISIYYTEDTTISSSCTFSSIRGSISLTAEVNDLDAPDSSMTVATSPGYLHYPSPIVYLANDRSNLTNELPLMSLPSMIWPSFSRDNGRTSLQNTDGDIVSNGVHQRGDQSASVRLLTYSTPTGQYELLLSPVEPNSSSPLPEETGGNPLPTEMETDVSHSSMEPMETMEVQSVERTTQFFPFGDPTSWELPFLQGWLIGQTQAGQRNMRLATGGGHENSLPAGDTGTSASVASSGMATSVGQSRVHGRSSSRHRSSRSRMVSAGGTAESGFSNIIHDGSDPQPAASRIQSELATSLAAAAAAELPCTVKLRIWPHYMKDPCAFLEPEKCRLTIPHAVLCSEMGAHFSPCGRFLAACVACMLPHLEADPGVQSQLNSDVAGVATSPTRHPILAHRVMYELRIYSLEEATFGLVLASRAIRAAHCLTSIQFSPTSEHILLAYGRRHSSLLKSVVIDGQTTVPIYTILEVYRVSDMELVRVLPSVEDEVNVACFHPSVGGGLVYGTKEGKLRILQYDSPNGLRHNTSGFLDENMLEVPTYALEC